MGSSVEIKRFRNESLITIYNWLRDQCRRTVPGEEIAFEAVNPDKGGSRYSGEPLDLEDGPAGHRTHRTWMDLGMLLDLRYQTPQVIDGDWVRLRYTVLDRTVGPHVQSTAADHDKYGVASEFARVRKLEEPNFLTEMNDALTAAKLPNHASILALGVNRADELAAFELCLSAEHYAGLSFVGVDISESALAVARERFPDARFRFICQDLSKTPELDLGEFDLVMCHGLLQSPALDGQKLLGQVVKRHLKPRAALLLSFPNCRYVDGEIKYGAKLKNYAKPELSLLVKDLFQYRRFLQQKGFEVTLTGKYDIFLTARRG